jgi:SAM-dependent methyltransferase
LESAVYDRMNELEAEHWWFVARRSIIATMIPRYLPNRPTAAILEAGCGSGGNLQMLGQFGKVDAFEFNEMARQRAAEKSGYDIRFGALPGEVPFDDSTYDLIGLFDVLEHVEADQASLAALSEKLAEGGRMIVTVPAFPMLWSRHDERHHHFRRYTRASLGAAAKAAGLNVVYSSYFNTLLFPAAVATRAVKRLTRSEMPDDSMPPGWLNSILTGFFRLERHLIGKVRLPVGLSLIAVLEKS